MDSLRTAIDAIAAAPRKRVGKASTLEQVKSGGTSYAIVKESPAELAASAGLSLDVYSVARSLESEEGGHPPAHMLAVAECTYNTARRAGISATTLLTRSSISVAVAHYGEQAGGHWASTRLDPTERSVKAAKYGAAGSSYFAGAADYFSPRSQDAGTQNGHVLRQTSESYIARNAKDGLYWIGPSEGIDEYELMVFSRQKAGTTDAALAALAAGRKRHALVVVAETGVATLALAALGVLALNRWG